MAEDLLKAPKFRVAKKIGLAIFFIAAAAGLFFIFSGYLDPEARKIREGQKFIKQLEEKYKNDPYGGATPEETLQLFIDALKKGDTELAAKYFILDKQDQWREDLSKIKEKNLLEAMVRDLEREKEKKPLGEGNSNRFNYFIYNDDNILSVVIDIGRSPNGIWKILDM